VVGVRVGGLAVVALGSGNGVAVGDTPGSGRGVALLKGARVNVGGRAATSRGGVALVVGGGEVGDAESRGWLQPATSNASNRRHGHLADLSSAGQRRLRPTALHQSANLARRWGQANKVLGGWAKSFL
jgi:hypothetical protein